MLVPHFSVREWLLPPLVLDKQGISLGRKSRLMGWHGVCEEELLGLGVHIRVKIRPDSTVHLSNSKYYQ